jgi:hypothetical protein
MNTAITPKRVGDGLIALFHRFEKGACATPIKPKVLRDRRDGVATTLGVHRDQESTFAFVARKSVTNLVDITIEWDATFSVKQLAVESAVIGPGNGVAIQKKPVPILPRQPLPPPIRPTAAAPRLPQEYPMKARTWRHQDWLAIEQEMVGSPRDARQLDLNVG